MNEQFSPNFGLASKIENRLQDIEAGRISSVTEATDTNKAAPADAKNIKGLPAEDFGKLLAAMEEKAALSGYFEPEVIIGKEVPTTARLLLLTRLVANCIVQTVNERIQWVLKQNRRKMVLTQLINDNTLQQKLAQPLPDTDKLGIWLRQLLHDEAIGNLQQLTRDDLLALAHATEALNGVPGLKYVPELSDILRHLETGRFLADYDILLLNGFFGRTNELQQLQLFLQQPRPTPRPPLLWDGILLTGMGGAGKSTLLARFIKDQTTQHTCTVAVLDFDRPTISPEDNTWLEMELSRQVGQQYPEAIGSLSQIRKQARLNKSGIDEYVSKADLESKSQFRGLSSSILDEMKRVLQDVKADHLPFLLVLDTFEEVAQRNFTMRLLSWLTDTAERLYPITVKVIISGRLFDTSVKAFDNYPFQKIAVNELEPVVAKQLLMNMAVKEEVANELVSSGSFPLRPLELKMLAKVITSDPDFSLQSLTDELQTSNPASKQLFAGIVYRRVLLRIQDEVVRTLACPGLVLHYVTKEIIQQVMVPALKMAPLSDEAAAQALNTLASYEWLAHRETDGSVWHSRDIRRSMLKVMIAYEPEKTRAIHEYATRYFSKRSLAREQAEAIYHRLMLVNDAKGQLPDKSEVIAVSQFISPYQAELPKTANVFFKYAIQGHIDYEELSWMPDRYKNEASLATGTYLCENRELGNALALIKTMQQDGRLSLQKWVSDTLYATAEWELLKQLIQPLSIPTAPKSWQAFGDVFFAGMVISTDLVNTNDFQQAVTTLFNEDRIPKDIGSVQGKLFLSRMAFTLVYIHSEQDLEGSCSRRMRYLIETIYNSEHIKATPGLKRNLFLLSLTVHTKPLLIYAVDLSLLNLDKSWLESLLQKKAGIEMNKAVETLLQRVLDALNDFSKTERKTAEGLLAKIDDLHKDDTGDLKIILQAGKLNKEDLLALVMISSPEFRDPCRFALLEAFTDSAAYQQLATIIASLLAWDLDDLQPAFFANNMVMDAEHALENYIELTDRCGKLGRLLQMASAALPDAPKLKLVLKAYSEWEYAIKSAVRGSST